MNFRATAYLRTSSASNVDGDSPYRQGGAVMSYAERQNITVLSCFWDAAVSGADPIEQRAGFRALLLHCEVEGIDTIIVEEPSRFARSVLAQELGIILLNKLGIRLLTSYGEDLTDQSHPAKNAQRQMAGLMAEYEKANTVMRLRHARDRVRAERGKCEGRKSHAESRPEIIREVRRLARRSPKTGKRRSFREISTELARLGFVTLTGRPISHTTVISLVAGGFPSGCDRRRDRT